MAKWKEFPSPEAIVKATLERAADHIAWDYNTEEDGRLTWACRKILTLASNPAEVAAILKKAGEDSNT